MSDLPRIKCLKNFLYLNSLIAAIFSVSSLSLAGERFISGYFAIYSILSLFFALFMRLLSKCVTK